MPYKITIKQSALREIEDLPSTIRSRVRSKIDMLVDEPRPNGAKKLHASNNAWRMRVGEYRVVYEIDDGIVTVPVIRVAHRKDVYR